MKCSKTNNKKNYDQNNFDKYKPFQTVISNLKIQFLIALLHELITPRFFQI